MRKYKRIIYLLLAIAVFLVSAVLIARAQDTTTVITHKTTSVTHEIWQMLTPLLWVLLFSGWLFYWLKKYNQCRSANPEETILGYTKIFWRENWIEVPSSMLACVLIGITTDLPPSAMNSKVVMGSVFSMGYSSSSIINALVTSTATKEKIGSLVSNLKPKPKE